MVKEVNLEETPFIFSKTDKYKQFCRDLKEIIDNKIEYCELVDMPYAPSTAVADLEYKARLFCGDYLWSIKKRRPEEVDFFKFAKRVENDKTCFYANFNVKAWDEIKDG